MADVDIQISEIKRALMDLVVTQESQERRIDSLGEKIDQMTTLVERLATAQLETDQHIERLLALHERQVRPMPYETLTNRSVGPTDGKLRKLKESQRSTTIVLTVCGVIITLEIVALSVYRIAF